MRGERAWSWQSSTQSARERFAEPLRAAQKRIGRSSPDPFHFRSGRVGDVPVEDLRHATNAYESARAILDCVSEREFAGERIRVRIGINPGFMVAGNVSGGGRQSYTVYGDTVNLASRLEGWCKEHGTARHFYCPRPRQKHCRTPSSSMSGVSRSAACRSRRAFSRYCARAWAESMIQSIGFTMTNFEAKRRSICHPCLGPLKGVRQ